MNWGDFWAALALVLVLEGLIPFISPGGYRNMVQQMSSMSDQVLRNTGLALIITGVVFLYLVRG
ncbi:MAG TPA: DUF2065 domain-containing protein [Gammaproteobacteria bacterium]|jgi:uncharacterized protein YjeT (DUF2065 family)